MCCYVNVNNFLYKLGQSWMRLTSDKPNMQSTKDRREYIFTRTFFLRAETWHTLPRGFGVLSGGARIYGISKRDTINN